jgi:hypothetical protein
MQSLLSHHLLTLIIDRMPIPIITSKYLICSHQDVSITTPMYIFIKKIFTASNGVIVKLTIIMINVKYLSEMVEFHTIILNPRIKIVIRTPPILIRVILQHTIDINKYSRELMIQPRMHSATSLE